MVKVIALVAVCAAVLCWIAAIWAPSWQLGLTGLLLFVIGAGILGQKSNGAG